MKQRKNEARRLNLALPDDLFKIIESNAQANYLQKATYVKQLLYKHLSAENNNMSNPLKNVEL